MNILGAHFEYRESCLEMAFHLHLAAAGRRRLEHQAGFVHRLYVSALSMSPGDPAHTAGWRRFIRALDLYVERCARGADADALRWLRGIVLENADLAFADARRDDQPDQERRRDSREDRYEVEAYRKRERSLELRVTVS